MLRVFVFMKSDMIFSAQLAGILPHKILVCKRWVIIVWYIWETSSFIKSDKSIALRNNELSVGIKLSTTAFFARFKQVMFCTLKSYTCGFAWIARSISLLLEIDSVVVFYWIKLLCSLSREGKLKVLLLRKKEINSLSQFKSFQWSSERGKFILWDENKQLKISPKSFQVD